MGREEWTRPIRLCLAGVIVVSTILLLSDAANAGGGSFFLVGPHGDAIFAPGDTMEVTGDVWLGKDGKGDPGKGYHAGPEHGPFFGYIVFRPNKEWGPFAPPLPKDARYVGRFTFEESRHPEAVTARLSFVLPQLEPGHYTFMHCNDPCTRQLSDLMSTSFTVVGDAGQAVLVERIQRLERKEVALKSRLRVRLGELGRLDGLLPPRIQALERRVAALEAAVRKRAPEALPSESQTSAAIFVAGGTAVGAGLLLWSLFSSRLLRLAGRLRPIRGPG